MTDTAAMTTRRMTLFPITGVAILIAACATPLPVLERTTDADAGLSCGQLDRAVANAVAIRGDAIEEGKVQAINEMIGARDVSAQLVVGVFAIGLPLPEDGSPPHVHSQRAAEVRIRQLLRYKAERSCPSRPTQDPDRTDLAIGAALESLDQSRIAGRLTRDEHQQQQSALIDDL